MAEYIEREAVLARLAKQTSATGLFGTGVTLGKDYAEAVVLGMPAADVVEVKHGAWVGSAFDFKCSVCDRYQGFYVGRTNYCPNCGARMDGE